MTTANMGPKKNTSLPPTEQQDDPVKRVKRFKMLNKCMRSPEIHRVFRERELQEKPEANKDDKYEENLQRSLLHPRERLMSSPMTMPENRRKQKQPN